MPQPRYSSHHEEKFYDTHNKTEKRNPYEILGVSPGATKEQIRSAYRKLALKYHPDKVKGDEDAKSRASKKFVEISAAYETLTHEADPTADGENHAGAHSSTFQGDSHRNHFYGQPSFEDFFYGEGTANDPFVHPFFSFTDPFELFRRNFQASSPRTAQDFLFDDFGMFDRSPIMGHFGSLFDMGPQMAMASQFQTGGVSGTSFQFSSSTGTQHGAGMTSISTSTQIIDGKRKTRTERTVVHPDGRRETTVEITGDEDTNDVPRLTSRTIDLTEDEDTNNDMPRSALARKNVPAKGDFNKKEENLARGSTRKSMEPENKELADVPKKRRFFGVSLPCFKRHK